MRYDPYTDSFIDNPTKETTATINLNAFPKNIIQMNVVEVSDKSIEKIADAVVRKLADRKTEPTISKMEQVEDEPKTQMKTQNSNLTFEKADERCKGCKHYKLTCDLFSEICKYEPKTEPQTENPCDGCVCDDGKHLMYCMNCKGIAWKTEPPKVEDEPQTERSE